MTKDFDFPKNGLLPCRECGSEIGWRDIEIKDGFASIKHRCSDRNAPETYLRVRSGSSYEYLVEKWNRMQGDSEK